MILILLINIFHLFPCCIFVYFSSLRIPKTSQLFPRSLNCDVTIFLYYSPLNLLLSACVRVCARVLCPSDNTNVFM